jgi:hypothetical protein
MPDETLLVVALAAAAVAAGLVLALAWPWRVAPPSRAALGWVLGVAAGFALGFYLGVRWFGWTINWPPTEGKDRLLLVVLPAAVLVECLAAFRRVRWWLAWPMRLVVAAGAARVILHGSITLVPGPFPDERTWSAEETPVRLAVLGLLLAGLWLSSALLIRQAPGWSVPLALAVVGGGAGVTIMVSGSLEDGGLGFPLAGALAGAALASLLVRPPVDGAHAIGLGTVGLFGLVILGHFFSELSETNAWLLLGAPLLGWLPELPYVRRLRRPLRDGLRVLLVAIPVGWALFQASEKSRQDAQPPSSPGNGNLEQQYKEYE